MAETRKAKSAALGIGHMSWIESRAPQPDLMPHMQPLKLFQLDWIQLWNSSPKGQKVFLDSLSGRVDAHLNRQPTGLELASRDTKSVGRDAASHAHAVPVLYLNEGFFPTYGCLEWLMGLGADAEIRTGQGALIGYLSFVTGGLQNFSGSRFKRVTLEARHHLMLEPPRLGSSAQADYWHLPEEEVTTEVKFLQSEAREMGAHGALFPIEVLLGEPGPWGAFARQCFKPAEVTAEGDFQPPYGDIDIIAVSTDRLKSVAHLLRSIRAFLAPQINVTIVVQCRQTLLWKILAQRYRARFIHVAEDTGLAACRNLAVRETQGKFIFLMDDDFQVDERCRLDAALKILTNHREISVLGGNLLDVERWGAPRSEEVSQGFAMHLLEEAEQIVWLRVEDAPRLRTFVNSVDYFETCDIVDNFALIRRDHVFEKGVFWNDELRIGAEHQDLYIRLKRLNPGAIVARTNTLKVRNVRVQSRRYKRMRYRVDYFFNLFFRDLGLKSVTIIGERQRVYSPEGVSAYLEQPQMHSIFPPGQRIT